MRRLSIEFLPDALAICRLAPEDALPEWATQGTWWSATRTPEEMSIVCAESQVPVDTAASRGWCALRVAGPLPLDQTGILASVVAPLAAGRVSVFALATFDTDYVLIPAAQRAAAIAALEAAGHGVASAGY